MPIYNVMMEQVLSGPAERHRRLFEELVATVGEHNPEVDRELLERAFTYACNAHEGTMRRSGEDFIVHPVGVARILAELRMDTATVAAALLHDVIEDTESTGDDLRAEFGEEITVLVEGVTKLTRIKFQSREQAQAENYRKMIVAMAQDIRVILIKLADRLHNMRTIEYLGKQKQIQKARETLEVYAPLAHRLGIHQIKWELEDLAFQTLHPRKYQEIGAMVAQRRADREAYVAEAGDILARELDKAGIQAEISGRAKHFYSIYEKMVKRGKEFNEIYDLTAMRVIGERVGREGQGDCYAVLGIIHSLWKPMPGRFKDYVAMPKFNMYRSLHTTVIGPEGKPLEIQVRTRDMHETAELGIAAHWLYKEGRKDGKAEAERLAWLKQLMDWQQDESDPGEFMRAFRIDLYADEVYVFTPKGEVKSLPSGSTPIDFAYAVHTDVGHRTVGAKVNGRIVPLHYHLKSGDFVEILTSKQLGRGPSRDWLSIAASSRARNKIRQWWSRETRDDTEQRGRETLEQNLKQHNLPYKKIAGSALLAGVIREMNFKKAEDFYIALGSGKLQPSQVVAKVLHRLKTTGPRRRGRPRSTRKVLQSGSGRRDLRVYLARQGNHDPSGGLPEREGAPAQPRAIHSGRVGGWRHPELPCPDRGRLVGSVPPARGRRPDVRRARGEHRRVLGSCRGSDGEELVRRRDRRPEGVARAAQLAPQHRERLRRVPRHSVVTDPAVTLLRELVAADEERAATLEEIDRLTAETAAVRERADELGSLIAAAPSERARLDGEVSAAEHEVHARAQSLEEAEAELAAAEGKGDEERLVAARRFLVRARDALSVAEKRAAASRSEATELEERLARAEREVPEVEERAATLARDLGGRPRLAKEAGREPEPGLEGVVEWSTRARAALAVARSTLSAERDAVIREANELGSVVLGEALVASSAALVAKQVEERFGSTP
jgi:GTP pyrophosphokinase